MGAKPVLTWLLMGLLIVMFAVCGYMVWNYRTMTASAESANALCDAIQPGMAAEDVVARVKAATGARLIAGEAEVSADFGRCICFVPIMQGKAAPGQQVGCQF
jgi:hypothetical protein